MGPASFAWSAKVRVKFMLEVGDSYLREALVGYYAYMGTPQLEVERKCVNVALVCLIQAKTDIGPTMHKYAMPPSFKPYHEHGNYCCRRKLFGAL